MYGIDAHLIDVEVDLYRSGSAKDFITVGMPDTAVRESRERIKSALVNSGFGYPDWRVLFIMPRIIAARREMTNSRAGG